MKKQALDDLVKTFALKQSGTFDFEKLVKYVRRTDKEFDDDGRLYELACESEWLFEDERDEIKELFVPRHIFFKGAELRVKPLPEEVAGGYLVPGHRFIPLISREIFPADVTLKLADDTVATKRTESFSYESAVRFLAYFGEYGMIDYLVHDHEQNTARIEPPFDKPVDMTVFDLSAFYQQCGFKAGDSLMLKVENWLKGEFSVRHIPAKGKTVDFVGTHAWVEALRAGFEEMRFQETPSYDCSEQAAWMFCLAEMDLDSPSVLSAPPLTLPEFFRTQKDLTMKSLGQVSFFWPVDEPVESRLEELIDSDGPEPETELDAIFQLLGLSVDSEDAEAYMRDSIASGVTDPEKVLARVISGRKIVFPNEIVRQDFIDLWEELWNEVKEAYDPTRDVNREMRSAFLKLNDQALAILRELDMAEVDPHVLMRNPATMKLGEISMMIHGALALSNQDDVDVEEMPLPLEEMSGKISAVLDDLAERLLGEQSEIKQEIADGPVYQLKISLKYSKPPIWRRILVPSGMSLEKLHEVIQVVFGWHNCHLHQFIDGRTFYQPGGEDDGFPGMRVEDSNGLRVCDLLRKEKDKIEYEYDFGDSWDHQIVLEKVLKPDPRKTLPLCTKGKLACPPEDCGGLNGYYQLLEILTGPDCKAKREMLEWHGGPIDPDAFDLVAVNARLKEWF